MPAPDSGKRKKVGIESQIQQQNILEDVAQFNVSPEKAPTVTGGHQYQGQAYRANTSNTWQGINAMFQAGTQAVSTGKQLYDMSQDQGAEDERKRIEEEMNRMQEEGIGQQEQWAWLENQKIEYQDQNGVWFGDLRNQTQNISYADQYNDAQTEFAQNAHTMSPAARVTAAKNIQASLPENQRYRADELVTNAMQNQQRSVAANASQAALVDVGLVIDQRMSTFEGTEELLIELESPRPVLDAEGNETEEQFALIEGAYEIARTGDVEELKVFDEWIRAQVVDRLHAQDPGMDAEYVEGVIRNISTSFRKGILEWRDRALILDSAAAQEIGNHAVQLTNGRGPQELDTAITAAAAAVSETHGREESNALAQQLNQKLWTNVWVEASEDEWIAWADETNLPLQMQWFGGSPDDLEGFLSGQELFPEHLMEPWVMNPNNPVHRPLVAKAVMKQKYDDMLRRANEGGETAIRDNLLALGAELEDPNDPSSPIKFGALWDSRRLQEDREILIAISEDALAEQVDTFQSHANNGDLGGMLHGAINMADTETWEEVFKDLPEPIRRQLMEGVRAAGTSLNAAQNFVAELDRSMLKHIEDNMPQWIKQGLDATQAANQASRVYNQYKGDILRSSLPPSQKVEMINGLDSSIGKAEGRIESRMNQIHTASQAGTSQSRARDTANDKLISGEGNTSASVAAMGGETDATVTQVATTHPGVMAAQTLTMERLQGFFPPFETREEEETFFYSQARSLYGVNVPDRRAWLLYQQDKQVIQEWQGGGSFAQVFNKLSPELQKSLHFKLDEETGAVIINPEERIANMSMFKATTEAKYYIEELDSDRNDLTAAHRTTIRKRAVARLQEATDVIDKYYMTLKPGQVPSAQDAEKVQAALAYIVQYGVNFDNSPTAHSIMQTVYNGDRSNITMRSLRVMMPTLKSLYTAQDLGAASPSEILNQMRDGHQNFLVIRSLLTHAQASAPGERTEIFTDASMAVGFLTNGSQDLLKAAITDVLALRDIEGEGTGQGSGFYPQSFYEGDLRDLEGIDLWMNDSNYSTSAYIYGKDGSEREVPLKNNPCDIVSQQLQAIVGDLGDGNKSSDDMNRTFNITSGNYAASGSSVYSQNANGEWGWYPANDQNIQSNWGGDVDQGQSQRIDPERFCIDFLGKSGRWKPPQYDEVAEREGKDHVTIALRDENGGWTYESIMAHYIATQLCPNGDTSAWNQACALAATINEGNPDVNIYRGWQGIGNILDLVDPMMDDTGWRIPSSPSGVRGVLEPLVVDPGETLKEDTSAHSLYERRAYEWFEITPRPGFDVLISPSGHEGARRGMVTSNLTVLEPGQTTANIRDHELGGDYVQTGGYTSFSGFATANQRHGFGLIYGESEAQARRINEEGEAIPYNNEEYYGISQVLIPYYSDPRSTGVLTDPFIDTLHEVTLADGTVEEQGVTVKRVQYAERLWGDLVTNAPLGFRRDGTPKHTGHHGIITNDEGQLVTELSFDFEADGVKYFAPLIVPDSTPEEIQFMANGGEPTTEMYEKAQQWAISQVSQGKSPFKESKTALQMRVRYAQFKQFIVDNVDEEIILTEATEGEEGSRERVLSGLDNMAARLLHIKPSEGWYPEGETTGWTMEERMGKHPTIAVLHGFNKVLLDCGLGGNRELDRAIDDIPIGPRGGIHWANQGTYRYDLSELDRTRTGRPTLVMSFKSGGRQTAETSNIHLRGNTSMSDPGFFGLQYSGESTLHELRGADEVTTIESRPDTGKVDVTVDDEGDQS